MTAIELLAFIRAATDEAANALLDEHEAAFTSAVQTIQEAASTLSDLVGGW